MFADRNVVFVLQTRLECAALVVSLDGPYEGALVVSAEKRAPVALVLSELREDIRTQGVKVGLVTS